MSVCAQVGTLADNQVTIVGGRNVGDVCFGTEAGLLFVDLDVLAIGPMVADVSRNFDGYWASDRRTPAWRLIVPATPSLNEIVRAEADRIESSPDAAAYAEAVAKEPLVRKMAKRDITFEWADTHLVSDDPAKGHGEAGDDTFMVPRLQRIMKPPTTGLVVVSAYFVPGEAGVRHLDGLARSGVKVTVLTNSLERPPWPRFIPATPNGGNRTLGDETLCGGCVCPTAPRRELGSSLHAKTFEVDRAQVFIGSFNVDPRSKRLNAELGFVIDSPSMATDLSEALPSGWPLAPPSFA